jgi:hypothetical protein
LSIETRTKDRWFEIGQTVVYCPPVEKYCETRGRRGRVTAIKKIPYIVPGERQKQERVTILWERYRDKSIIRDTDLILDDDVWNIWGLERCEKCPFRMEQMITGRCPVQVKAHGEEKRV